MGGPRKSVEAFQGTTRFERSAFAIRPTVPLVIEGRIVLTMGTVRSFLADGRQSWIRAARRVPARAGVEPAGVQCAVEIDVLKGAIGQLYKKRP